MTVRVGSQWFSAAEIARLRLWGMPTDKRSVNAMAAHLMSALNERGKL